MDIRPSANLFLFWRLWERTKAGDLIVKIKFKNHNAPFNKFSFGQSTIPPSACHGPGRRGVVGPQSAGKEETHEDGGSAYQIFVMFSIGQIL